MSYKLDNAGVYTISEKVIEAAMNDYRLCLKRQAITRYQVLWGSFHECACQIYCDILNIYSRYYDIDFSYIFERIDKEYGYSKHPDTDSVYRSPSEYCFIDTDGLYHYERGLF